MELAKLSEMPGNISGAFPFNSLLNVLNIPQHVYASKEMSPLTCVFFFLICPDILTGVKHTVKNTNDRFQDCFLHSASSNGHGRWQIFQLLHILRMYTLFLEFNLK